MNLPTVLIFYIICVKWIFSLIDQFRLACKVQPLSSYLCSENGWTQYADACSYYAPTENDLNGSKQTEPVVQNRAVFKMFASMQSCSKATHCGLHRVHVWTINPSLDSSLSYYDITSALMETLFYKASKEKILETTIIWHKIEKTRKNFIEKGLPYGCEDDQ